MVSTYGNYGKSNLNMFDFFKFNILKINILNENIYFFKYKCFYVKHFGKIRSYSYRTYFLSHCL